MVVLSGPANEMTCILQNGFLRSVAHAASSDVELKQNWEWLAAAPASLDWIQKGLSVQGMPIWMSCLFPLLGAFCAPWRLAICMRGRACRQSPSVDEETRYIMMMSLIKMGKA